MRPGKLGPGVSQAGVLPPAPPHPPHALVASLLLSFSASCPGALTFVLTFSTWTPFLLSSSSLLLCLTQEASRGDLSGGILGSSCNQQAHSQRQTYPTTTPAPGMPPLEFPARVFLQVQIWLEGEAEPFPSKMTFALD